MKAKDRINTHREIDGIQHITIPSFSEDNNGKPNAEYAVFDTETMSLKIKSLD
ncbi:hypothetical protein N9J72_01085 [Candidatus Gracilibacteria bacterium]|nr:hypothetical protein [Candidatus Gracilibacteria bacterium]